MIACAVLSAVCERVSVIRCRIAGAFTSRMPSYVVIRCPGLRQ